jgi:hypothetical protein
MPINYAPPADRQIAEELEPIRAAVLQKVTHRQILKRVSLVAVAMIAVTVGGVGVAVANGPGDVNSEFRTKPQYVAQFAECMANHGWDPIAGSNDPAEPSDVPAVHFTFYSNQNEQIIADADSCRRTVSDEVGESIVRTD